MDITTKTLPSIAEAIATVLGILTGRRATVEDVLIETASDAPHFALASQRRTSGDMALLRRIGGEWTFAAQPIRTEILCHTEIAGCPVSLRTMDYAVVSFAEDAIDAGVMGVGVHDFGKRT